MKLTRNLSTCMLLPLVGVIAARAVYAPIPEEEQGKALTAYVGASIYHDSNLFAARSGPISSFVHELTPELKFNASLSPTTFASAGYKLTLDHMDDRPGVKTIVSHDLSARLAHQFSERLTIDVHDFYSIAKNPQSLLAGVTLNTDQSFRRNEIGGSAAFAATRRLALTLRGSFSNFAYDNSVLAASIDHDEALFGLEAGFDLRADLRLIGEYRHQIVSYDTGGATKDKNSNFFLAGVKYTVNQKLVLTARVGAEDRNRSGAPGTTAPFAELSAKYDYGPRSFISGGYSYTLDETSNIAVYSDTQVSRFFLNVQHQIGGSLVASGSINYEPSVLQGRPTISPDRDDTTTRLGLALTWLGIKNWSISSSFDYDRVSSQDTSRDYNRSRVGMSARRAF